MTYQYSYVENFISKLNSTLGTFKDLCLWYTYLGDKFNLK